ncbi:MAG: hypothetical protein ACM3Q2_01650, partial [Syntrophothermus sp.]
MTIRTLKLSVIILFILALRLQATTLQADSASLNKAAAAQMDVYQMPATLHIELTGKNTPSTGLTSADMLSKRMCKGEFSALSLFLQPTTQVNNVRFGWTDFTSKEGYKFTKDNLDVSIAKVWYQAGYQSDQTNNKHLTQEVLVKNDNLIKVDYNSQTNYLLVSRNGSSFYQNISDPGTAFPTDVTVLDSTKLQPLNLDGTTNRQIWLTVHVPDNAQPGKYTSQLTISSDLGVIKAITVQVEVLPFNLDPSKLEYSIYYDGYADPYTKVPYSFTTKTPEQYRIEMQDMKDHGVLYPTTYQILKNLDLDLQIRQQVGLPNDKLYAVSLETGNS